MGYFCGSNHTELAENGRIQQRRDQAHRGKVAQ
jgi:hypothetical protein